jgi:hypothetical protein
MADELDRAVAALGDRSKTWVDRRDAADWLGGLASRCLKGLAANRLDDDTDVRAAVERGLTTAKQGLGGVSGERSKATVEGLVKAIEKPGVRDVRAVDGGFEITVALREGRSQKVRVATGKSQSGDETVRVSTRCGPALDKALRWVLKTNAGFTHCGMAIVEEGGNAWFDLVNSILLETATVDEFKACVKEIAFYGDWAESKLTQGDEF